MNNIHLLGFGRTISWLASVMHNGLRAPAKCSTPIRPGSQLCRPANDQLPDAGTVLPGVVWLITVAFLAMIFATYDRYHLHWSHSLSRPLSLSPFRYCDERVLSANKKEEFETIERSWISIRHIATKFSRHYFLVIFQWAVNAPKDIFRDSTYI